MALKLPRGLYPKYYITKYDRSPVDSDGIYFVLKLNSKDAVHRDACQKAAMVYAEEIASHPNLCRLAVDLVKQVSNLRIKQAAEAGKECVKCFR